jgi:hypothetical protein
MTEQARDKDGKFASGGHTAEQATREAGRAPVTAHDGHRSVGTQTGRMTVQQLRSQYAPKKPDYSAAKGAAGRLGMALLGIGMGAAGTFIGSALRNQGGRRH